MSTVEIRDGADGKRLGSTNTHRLPRVGEAISWRETVWRVIDILHPTQDQSGVVIHVPRVFVAETNNGMWGPQP